MVSDILSRDATPKPLCQRCYSSLSDARLDDMQDKAQEKRVSSIVKLAAGTGPTSPTAEKIQAAQELEF